MKGLPPRSVTVTYYASLCASRAAVGECGCARGSKTRKPSAHTMKAYRQDFIAIASLITDGDPARLAVTDITKDSDAQCVGRLRA